MIDKPVCSALLGHRRSLVNTPSVLNHDGCHKTTILGSPPSRNPIASSLFFKGASAQEAPQPFFWQRHMNILKLGESKVSTLGQPTCSMGVYVTTQGRVLFAVCSQIVRIKVTDVTGHSFIRERVSFGMGRGHIVQQEVYCINGSHTVSLSHDP